MKVKVLNGCGLNSRYWVYAGATREHDLTVTGTDTVTGASRTYHNNLATCLPPWATRKPSPVP